MQVFPFALHAVAHAADLVQEVIRRRAAQGRLALLVFDMPERDDAPDSITLLLAELARRVSAGTLSLANVAALPVWDWWPTISAEEGRSARLRHMLQSQTDICGANIWSLEGGEREALPALCTTIENRIADLGGIDAVILGSRPDCQFGQNELDGWKDSRTRLVFAMQGDQPRRAVTLGLANLREAEKVILLCTGAECDASTLWHSFDYDNTALANSIIIADRAAATHLSSVGSPWRVGPLADVDRQWDDLTIAHAAVAGSASQPADIFSDCPELLATFAGVEPHQDPRPQLNQIAERVIRHAVKPIGWKSVLIVSRHADDAPSELPGMLQCLSEQLAATHTVCVRGASLGSRVHSVCAADTFAAWKTGISAAIATHRPDHIITMDDVSGVLSHAALAASIGHQIQVLCARRVPPWQFQSMWLSPSAPLRGDSGSPRANARAFLQRIIGTENDIEILGLVQ